jgi:GTPase involved in cell partitioning and DNA repair
LIDGNDEDPFKSFEALKNELISYNSSLIMKPILLVRTKGDALDKIDHTKWNNIPEFFMEISAVTGDGLLKLVKEISGHLDEK